MKKSYLVILFSALVFSSCNEAFWQGMAQGAAGMGGYGMGGYQVMPGGFVRNTSMDYLLDPRYAMQQVLNQEQQEYQAAKQYRPNLTLEQFRIEKGQAYQMMKNSGGSSSSSSSSSSLSSSSSRSSSSSSSSSGKMCRLCAGTGTCKTCTGRGYYYNPLDLSKTVLCPNCHNHDGKCSSCGGTGYK